MKSKLKALAEKLKDERSRKVLFVSHCLLNENTRYLGGAFCGGINSDVLKQLSESNCGLVQMPCPEQIAWGGVLKRLIWLPAGTRGTLLNFLVTITFPFFMVYTRLVYSRLASRAVSMIEDYIDSGFTVAGIVGIDGSPTCGVGKNLSVRKSLRYISGLSIDSLNRDEYNRNLYRSCLEKGPGIFINTLSGKLKKKGLEIRLFSLDLEDEMNGRKIRLEL